MTPISFHLPQTHTHNTHTIHTHTTHTHTTHTHTHVCRVCKGPSLGSEFTLHLLASSRQLLGKFAVTYLHLLFISPIYSTCSKTDRDLTAVQALCVGATARSLTASCFIPVTVVKTRFEVSELLCSAVYVAS